MKTPVWTKEQKRVIDTRNSNILVSAAAGSGKTAVLVARILDLIENPNDQMDIDELLIVTFTRAAAGEMRDRITRALADARDAHPDDPHLARQTTLIHNAQITTIDGFCSYVIRNYAQTAGLVPGFRMTEEGEAELLRSDALGKVMEEAYASTDPEELRRFHAFVDTFAPEKSDQAAEDLILKVYAAAESSPYPEKWLEQCRKDNEISDFPEFIKSGWMVNFMKDAADSIELAGILAQQNLDLAQEEDGPGQYLPAAESDAAFLASLKEHAADYDACQKILREFPGWAKLSGKKAGPEEKVSLRETFKTRRQQLKDIIKDLTENVFRESLQDAFALQKKSAGPILTLINLTERLIRTYTDAKRRKNLMDFSDLEHTALTILRDENGKRTAAAKELSGRFRAVMIDEYQDSNYLQEAILTAVSRQEDDDHPEQNYFCVGDVKQSIYSFRQARPDLFMRKYEAYGKKDGGVRIDLHKNFRSRDEVVDTVNGIFRQIMRREVGGVEYDADAELVRGASWPDGSGFETEILPVATQQEVDQEELLDDVRGMEQRELEARAVGNRIRELVGHFQIGDQKTGAMRPAEYRDIVILLRTTKVWADEFVRVLEDMRIPVYSESKTGYFQATEVDTVLNYLSIVDNPQQDIPFTAVLHSPFASLTTDDLARVRSFAGTRSWSGSTERQNSSMYDAARAYAADGESAALREKLGRFFAFFDSICGAVHEIPLHELIDRIVTESGYMDYASALPGGEQRAVNLNMLKDRAVSYEKTSYIGLFNFIRYIRQMKDRDIDLGELSSVGENENVVRIYSIHKSKGLEYPIVFVSGLGKNFNLRDANGAVLIHPELGIASDYVDYEKRVRIPTMRKRAIRNRKIKDSIGEELRILYVALTRAKQKLILTGSVKDEKALEAFRPDLPLREKQFPSAYISRVRNYLGWILPAADRMRQKAAQTGTSCCVRICPVKPTELAASEVRTSVRSEKTLEELRRTSPDVVYDRKMRGILRERFSYRYPYEGYENIPVEISVTELKEALMPDQDEDFPEQANAEQLYPDEQEDPLVPEFIRKMRADKNETDAAEPKRLTGSLRGSAYHRVLEVFPFRDFAEDSTAEKDGSGYIPDMTGNDNPGRAEQRGTLRSEIDRRLDALLRQGKLTEEERVTVRSFDLAGLIAGSLGRRIVSADSRGDLCREQPFVVGVPASSIREEWPEEEMIFVQGMIDAFFFEDDGIVLVDYKTDHVRDAKELEERYRIQLEQYANALEKATGKAVKESFLWSFALGREVRL